MVCAGACYPINEKMEYAHLRVLCLANPRKQMKVFFRTVFKRKLVLFYPGNKLVKFNTQLFDMVVSK